MRFVRLVAVVVAVTVALLAATGSSLALVIPAALAVGVLLATSSDPALGLVCVGLVTLSWDRVSVVVGAMTLKPAYLAFTLAFVIETLLPPARRSEDPLPEPTVSRLALAALGGGGAACIVFLALATAAGGFMAEGGRQLFVIVVGAFIPGWVTYRVGRTAARRRAAIAWALAGAALTTVVALWQFASVRLGLPTVLPYTSEAKGLGRTAGLSYEPAFFAMYLLSLIPLVVGRLLDAERSRAVRGRRSGLLLLLLFGVVLSNSRAGYLVLVPAVMIPVVMRRSGTRALVLGPVALALVAVVGLSLVTGFDAYRFSRERLASIADPTETSSNAPRLRLYKVETRIARDHPWLGIGPGTLSRMLPEYGFPPQEYQHSGPPGTVAPAWRVVANNIWLQAVLDGGLGAVAATVCVLWGLYCLARRSPDQTARWLAVGCLLVLLVGGALTSIFWDVRLWALIGLCAAAAATADSSVPAGGMTQTPEAVSL